MAELISWLNKNISSFQPDEKFAAQAARHLSRIERNKLFSPEIEHMRTAEGRWYEAIIYEMFLDIAEGTDEIRAVALKGADAPKGLRSVRLGQNGFFYSRNGDITIRGNGQDLAEFDLVLLDRNGGIAFGEVVTSPSDLKEFEKEVAYKKRLLGYLFGQQHVPFLLVSSFDISHYSVVRRLMKSKDNINIRTISCEQIKGLVKHRGAKFFPVTKRHNDRGKVFRVTEIDQKVAFDYEKYHDSERNKVFSQISGNIDIKNNAPEGTSLLVKKILYGGLYPSAVKSLCRERDFLIRGEKLEFNHLMDNFSKVILATDLPGYEPLVYLRSKSKREYLKMVQDKDGNFKFERRTPPKVGFFLWLESLPPTLGSRITHQILSAFSPGNGNGNGNNRNLQGLPEET
ncbi:MAG TPA: hypothetical protein VMS89_08345 [Methanoregulaceae archaeon]|nr:hypothetical protein [Methanoregulaceae archaeon]